MVKILKLMFSTFQNRNSLKNLNDKLNQISVNKFLFFYLLKFFVKLNIYFFKWFLKEEKIQIETEFQKVNIENE